jgi:hypothetical protein
LWKKWEGPAGIEKKRTRKDSIQWRGSLLKDAEESELLDILLREAIVGVPGFDWKRRKNILYENGRSGASRSGE